MGADKEEALKSIQVAKKAILDGNIVKATKFLEKSIRICPTDEARELLEELSKTPNGKNEGSKMNGDHKPKSEPSTPRREASPLRRNVNPEHLQIVKKITNSKTYYDVFDMTEENFSESELKKKYKKLALLVHPDKNFANGSAEAFKKVGTAYNILTDRTKRADYDYRLKHQMDSPRSYSTHEYTAHETHPDMEDIFNQFFRSGFTSGTRRTYYYQRPQRAQRTADENSREATSFLAQVAPMIFLVTITLIGSFFQTAPAYSLVRSDVHVVQRTTSGFGMEYYVVKDFLSSHTARQIRDIENWVDGERVHALHQKCFREQRMASQYRYRNDKRDKQIYPSCQRLKDLNIDYYRLQDF